LSADYGFRSELLFNSEELLGDGVERLVPADSLPLALTPLTHPLERKVKAVGMIEELYRCPALCTDISL
jgi:hypothetical protein